MTTWLDKTSAANTWTEKFHAGDVALLLEDGGTLLLETGSRMLIQQFGDAADWVDKGTAAGIWTEIPPIAPDIPEEP